MDPPDDVNVLVSVAGGGVVVGRDTVGGGTSAPSVAVVVPVCPAAVEFVVVVGVAGAVVVLATPVSAVGSVAVTGVDVTAVGLGAVFVARLFRGGR